MDRQLVKLLPQQIGPNWSLYRDLIMAALPPGISQSPEGPVNMLHALLEERAQLWLYFKKGEPWAVVTTTVYTDPIMHQRFLYIYTLFALADLDKGDLAHGLDVLARYAKSIDTTGMVLYTSIDSVRTVLQRFGGDTEFSFTFIPID